jgi:hypothetical protein
MSFCYKDGGEVESTLSQDQKDRMIKEKPSLFEMCSYTWYVSNCALGVFFEFSDYIRYIEGTKEYKNSPSPILPSLKSLATAILCTGFFIVVSNYFWVEYIFAPDYASHSFIYKVYYYYVAMTIKRFFYYGPFMFTTGAIQATGLGYNGNGKWDKVVGADIVGVETADSVMVMLRAWNH